MSYNDDDFVEKVHSVKFCECPKVELFCVISALRNPSQSTNAEIIRAVFAILDKITGVPCTGFCSGTVEFSLTCGHIDFFLFVCLVFFCPSTEIFTHMETSSLPVKGCKF